MRATPRACAMLGLAIGAAQQPTSVLAAEILAEPPSDLIVTVYRAPYRNGGSIDLDDLQGFALVSETRIVHLPAGRSRLRFEGVADGIEPASAIITGFPGGVIEKNRDARLLSPAALIASTLGKPVELLRTIRKTGKTERLTGTLLSDAGGGVVFKTPQGIEALRCSGLPETFSFEPVSGLSARPTLSVEVRSPRAETKQVTLSYLSRGFDWAADYTVTLSDDGKSFELGAWVTLANSNGVGFPSAHTQVVAGTVNRANGEEEVEPIDIGGPVLARCWPRGSTSDVSEIRMFKPAHDDLKANAPMPMAMRVGSLQEADSVPAHRLLRTKNTAANHLGLPLPSGSVAVFGAVQGLRLLENESDLRDIAVDEEVEINMGESPDVQVTATKEKVSVDAAQGMLPLVPGGSLRSVKIGPANRVAISNARPSDVQFELRLQLEAGARVVRADHRLGTKNGRPIFRLHVPAHETVTVRYQIQRTDDRILRTP